jgi:hypothetical protein
MIGWSLPLSHLSAGRHGARRGAPPSSPYQRATRVATADDAGLVRGPVPAVAAPVPAVVARRRAWAVAWVVAHLPRWPVPSAAIRMPGAGT